MDKHITSEQAKTFFCALMRIKEMYELFDWKAIFSVYRNSVVPVGPKEVISLLCEYTYRSLRGRANFRIYNTEAENVQFSRMQKLLDDFWEDVGYVVCPGSDEGSFLSLIDRAITAWIDEESMRNFNRDINKRIDKILKEVEQDKRENLAFNWLYYLEKEVKRA